MDRKMTNKFDPWNFIEWLKSPEAQNHLYMKQIDQGATSEEARQWAIDFPESAAIAQTALDNMHRLAGEDSA